MVSTVVGIVMLVGLGIWHLRNRRHPRWREERDARFYINSGSPLLAIGAYFLLDSASNSDWIWTLGCFWTLLAMISFVYGFQLLNTPPARESAANPAAEPAIQPAFADKPAHGGKVPRLG